jgi:hypothetical protein
MAGEGAREIGVLVFVFALLDGIVANKSTVWWPIVSVSLGAVFFTIGCYIEAKRSDDG